MMSGSQLFGHSSGLNFVLNNVECNGQEEAITGCSHSNVFSNCDHLRNEAAVRCQPGQYV